MSINAGLIKKSAVGLSICLVMAVANALAQTSFQIVPGGKGGSITSRSSEEDLRKIYGHENVEAGEVDLGEGESMPGTIIYPNDPRKRLEIAWKDTKTKKSPDFVQFSGEKSIWKVTPGIGLGTSLKTLEQINGRAFVLLGFEWDLGGTVVNWKSGKLARSFGKTGDGVILRLSPVYENESLTKDLNAVSGDVEFSSKNKSMQRLNPKVYFVIVKFR